MVSHSKERTHDDLIQSFTAFLIRVQSNTGCLNGATFTADKFGLMLDGAN